MTPAVMDDQRIRAAVRELTAYTLPPRVARDKLDQNEPPFDWPDELKREVLDRVRGKAWNTYPDFELTALRQALAERYDLEPANLLAGNGSNELLLTALLTLVAPGTLVLSPVPGFPLYETLTRVIGGRFEGVPLDPASGRLPVDEIVRRARAASTPPLIVVCSPNNPTGGILEEGELEALLDSGATVLLDRAYGDFVPDQLPPLHERLIILSSFSKSAALAGLRVGWLAATRATCEQLRKVRLPYSLNIFSSEAASVALAHPELQRRLVSAVSEERMRVSARLRELAIEVFPSFANFLCFRLPQASAAFDRLYVAGVLVRDVSRYPSLTDCLRVSIGTPEQNDRFLAILEECIV